jgi:DNA-binding XRE family transcriptional regulator
MIATVKRPGFEMRGNIPEEFIEITRKFFGEKGVKVVKEKDDELVDITTTKWYKKQEAERDPSFNLKFYRGLHKYTQAELAKKVGALPHHVSEMETGKRAISKAMALKLAKIFNVSPDRFI